ncbi:AraC-like DNA-binding protein [Tenacibaculum adriaticum]|uniref:AraC-like DNA-binding protein n=1 Tax=Tenacibaculum adriaticum TaxID=413713 RepID=A0A5S5DLH6_9FLAO|nr:AraC family transcriptional regulator [Tenacibaculum adriaticum]TYP96494.1 AraC-like DNA-binding protein [Tenacibaculum adriaticum]
MRPNYIFITLLPFLLFFYNLSSQNLPKNESFYLEKLASYRNIDNDSFGFYAKKLQNSKIDCNKIEGFNSEAYFHYCNKNYDKAEKYANITLNEIEKILIKKPKDSCIIIQKMSAINRLFWISKNRENYTQAYEYLLQKSAINKSSLVNKRVQLTHRISTEMEKALIKKELRMEEESKEILLALISEINSETYINNAITNDNLKIQKAHILNSVGTTYMALSSKKNNQSLLDSAQIYYDKAYETVKQLNPLHKDSEIIYNFRKTEVLVAKKEYKKALELINNYPNISNGYNYHHHEYLEKMICFHNLNKVDSAIYYANKLLKEKCKRSTLITVYDILSNQYYNLRKLDSAYKYSKLTINEFNIAKEHKEKTYQLLYNNDFEKAKKLNHLITEQESKSKIILIIFISLFSALSLSFLYYYFYIKRGNKTIKNLTENTNNQAKVEYNIDVNFEKEIISKIKEMDKNLEFLNSDFSINSIAEKLNTNSTYISFIFNKNKGETFKQYYTKRKINYLVNKLKTDKTFRKYSIQSLAEEIGYSNASAFTRAFKKHLGITPSVFLKTLEE